MPTHIDGMPIFNAKKPLELEILPADCKGDPKDPSDCAVARAVKRVMHALEVRAHLSAIVWRTNNVSWTRARTPAAMRVQMIVLDQGGRFQPGHYYLAVMGPRKSSGRAQGSSTNRKGNGGPKRRPPMVLKDVRMELT